MQPDQTRQADNDFSNGDEMLDKAMVEILRSIKNVRFGSVEITIHDSRVVQIERKEKVRLAPPPRVRAD